MGALKKETMADTICGRWKTVEEGYSLGDADTVVEFKNVY